LYDSSDTVCLEKCLRQFEVAQLSGNHIAEPGSINRLGGARRIQEEGYSERGLKISGRWRDHESLAIVAEDWRAIKRRVTTVYQLHQPERGKRISIGFLSRTRRARLCKASGRNTREAS
jgi:collagenase-like PrtC family protease